LMGDSDTYEAHPSLTLCIFDNLELSSHFFFSPLDDGF